MLKTVLVTLLTLIAMVAASSGRASMALLADFDSTEKIADFNAQSGDEVREEFKQTYPLAATGRVSLENINGAVHITVWDRNEIQVNALKRAYRTERLAEARINVRAADDSIRIKTEYPSGSQSFTDHERSRMNNPATVDYSLTVPRRVRLESIELINGELRIEGTEGDVKASSVNGRVTARGLIGEARLSTVNGPLEATFTRLADTKTIQLNSVNGTVVLIIPSDANAIIRAGTVHGAIKNDFGLAVQHGNYVGQELHGQLGSGGPRIRLGNVNGGVTIKQAQDGRKRSSVTDLASQTEKDKTAKDEIEKQKQGLRQVSSEVRRAEVEAARAARQVQVEAREIERALRDAQREIQRAQLEVQRETRRRLRQQMRSAEGSVDVKGSGKGAGEAVRRKYVEQETKAFVVTARPRVNIGTFEGSIKIHGWDKSEVMYKAVKQGRDPQEAKQILVRSGQQGSAVSIIASSNESSGLANLEIYVPRDAIVTATSAGGSMSVKGVTGEMTLRTGDGPIEVTNGAGRLNANTGDGMIRILNFEGQVDARTGDGPVSLDGRFTRLSVRTGHGTISLKIPPDSDFTIETNVDMVSNEGLTLTEDISPSKRVKRWKVGRGGNVFTLNTAEGKIILQPR